jgi:hypothetical protein
MIRFKCPSCGAVMTAPDTAAGCTGACPKCGQRLRIPPVPAKPAVNPPSACRHKRRHLDKGRGENSLFWLPGKNRPRHEGASVHARLSHLAFRPRLPACVRHRKSVLYPGAIPMPIPGPCRSKSPVRGPVSVAASK